MSNNNSNWTTVGYKNTLKNKRRRQTKKIQIINQQKRDKLLQTHREKEREQYQLNQHNNWRRERIALIKQKELDEYKLRRITSEFSQAIQNERCKANMTRKQLALKIQVQESELAKYENSTKCPNSKIIVELRKLFENLPRKYFQIPD